MKDIGVKIWPELLGYSSVLIPFPKIGNRENSVFLDFSNCKEVNASGLTLFLIQLLKLITSDQDNRSWYKDEEDNVQLIEKITNLNFFELLSRYSKNGSLFQSNLSNKANSNLAVTTDNTLSLPIYIIDFKNFDKRRMALNSLKEWVYNNLTTYYSKYDFILPQLISIINEIAKNSADHTLDNAFLGIDIIELIPDKKIKICFSIGDLGVGINDNIKNHLPKQHEKRYDYWDLTQTYRLALTPGFTTKEYSKENKGLGMSLIIDGAAGIDLSLSLFDANSRAILSNISSLTHEGLRKNFINIGREVGFFYYGELTANII